MWNEMKNFFTGNNEPKSTEGAGYIRTGNDQRLGLTEKDLSGVDQNKELAALESTLRSLQNDPDNVDGENIRAVQARIENIKASQK